MKPNSPLSSTPGSEKTTQNTVFPHSAEVQMIVEGEQREVDKWLAENAAAISSSNAYVEALELPLARFRQF